MTAEIVNLNKIRKARARAERERQAAENRANYGQTKADRQATEARLRKTKDTLDGSRRESSHPSTDSDETSDAS